MPYSSPKTTLLAICRTPSTLSGQVAVNYRNILLLNVCAVPTWTEAIQIRRAGAINGIKKKRVGLCFEHTRLRVVSGRYRRTLQHLKSITVSAGHFEMKP